MKKKPLSKNVTGPGGTKKIVQKAKPFSVSNKKLVSVKPLHRTARKPAAKVPDYELEGPKSFFKAKIKVIGLGGGGSSIVSEIGKSLNKATFLTADTDIRSARKKGAIKKVIFGHSLTHGLGTGANAELGRQAAEQEKEKIASFFQDQDIVILIASLGGGFGSGAAQVFADAARDFNGITFGIFTLPFKFEGKNKHAAAAKALRGLRRSLNVSLTISNEKIFKIIDSNVSISEAFSMVNKKLIDLLDSLIDLIYNPGIINIDFADLRAILKSKGNTAFLNTAEAAGKNRADQVIEKILHNPLYQTSPFKTEKILFNIAGGENVSLIEVDKISRAISDAHADAKIIFGISKNSKLKNKIKTTLLMTGPGPQGPVPEEKPVVPMEVKKTAASAVKPAAVKKKAPKAVVKKKAKPKKSSFGQVVAPVFSHNVFQNQPVEAQDPAPSSAVKPAGSEVEKKPLRRNALEIREAQKVEEDKQSLQEKEWEIPAFLRNKAKSR
jgi:cell division protein FtsZ